MLTQNVLCVLTQNVLILEALLNAIVGTVTATAAEALELFEPACGIMSCIITVLSMRVT